jgi:hypothetical protein
LFYKPFLTSQHPTYWHTYRNLGAILGADLENTLKWEWHVTWRDRVVIVLQALVVIALGAGMFTLGWLGVMALVHYFSGT